MLGRALSLGIWLVVAASAVFWGLRLTASSSPVPEQAGVAGLAAARGDLARVLGAESAPSAAAEPDVQEAPSRFQLVGVVAPRNPAASEVGLALIALDGKPAKAYRVGSRVDGETVLQSVNARGAELGPRDGPAAMRLELAALPPPTTGVPGGMPGAGPPLAPGVQGPVPGRVPTMPPSVQSPVPGAAPRFLPSAGVPPGGLPGIPRPGLAGQGPPPQPVEVLQDEQPEGQSSPLERNQQR